MSVTIVTYPEVATAEPEGLHRDDMAPERALFECFDLWVSGCWPDENAAANLEEVMGHIARLLHIPGEPVNAAAGPAPVTTKSTDRPARARHPAGR